MGKKTIEENTITEGIIWKQLLIFFFPIMLGTLIQQLYTTVDTIIVGRFVGKAALASVGGPAAVLSTIVVTFFNGLANGAAVVIAQYYGAKDKGRLHTGLHTAYLFSIVVSLVISVVGAVLTPWLLKIMNTPQDMMASSTTYLRIYFMGILFTLVYNMGAAIMRAVGDSKRPLLYLVVCCVLNIGLDIFMVVILKMGIAGAALATVFSQCVSAFLVTWSLTKDYDSMKLQFRELRMEACVLKRELKIGIPGALQACAYGVTNVVIQASINSFGTDTAAGWAAYGKLDLIFWTVSSALGAAVTTFVGQNYGAGNKERVRNSYFVSLAYSFGIGLVIGVTLEIFGTQFLSIFTTEQAVVDAGMKRLGIMGFSYCVSAFMDAAIAASRGLGKSVVPTIIVIMGSCVFRIIWVYTIFAYFKTIPSLYLLYVFSWSVTAIVEMIYFKVIYHKQMTALRTA